MDVLDIFESVVVVRNEVVEVLQEKVQLSLVGKLVRQVEEEKKEGLEEKEEGYPLVVGTVSRMKLGRQ